MDNYYDINSKNFMKLKKKNLKNQDENSLDPILNILSFTSPREKYLFIIDINKYFYNLIESEINQEYPITDEIKTNLIKCTKDLKEDFSKIDFYKTLLYNYGLNQPNILLKYKTKYNSDFILYKTIYLLSYNLFKEMQQIDLQKQNMGPDSLILLRVLLKKTNSLIGINLAYNNISDDGCKILKNCLETNKTLQSINLDCNSIGDLGLTFLTSPIVNHRFLKTIKLALNVITIVGIDNLTMAMKNANSTLINVIDLKYNNYKIDSDEKYKDFKFLKISYN